MLGTGLLSMGMTSWRRPVCAFMTCRRSCPDADIFCRQQLPVPVGTINRLVVQQKWRNLGIASQLDVRRIQAARDDRAQCLVVSTSGRRLDALQNYGFRLSDCYGPCSFAPSLTLRRGLILML